MALIVLMRCLTAHAQSLWSPVVSAAIGATRTVAVLRVIPET
jgi:hypothetical protein